MDFRPIALPSFSDCLTFARMKRLISLVFIIAIGSPYCRAQRDSLTIMLQSPYKAMSLLKASLNGGDIDDAAIVINSTNLNVNQKVRYLEKYRQVLSGSGIVIYLDHVPTAPDYFDSLSQSYRYPIHHHIPHIYLQRINGRWQFPEEVLAAIDKTHGELFRFGNGLFLGEKAKNNWLSHYMAGLQIWQWIGILTILTICVVIRIIFKLIFERLLLNLLKQIDKDHIGKKYIVPIAKPTAWFVALLFATLIYPPLQLPQLVSHYILIILKIIIPLFGMIILYRLVNIVEIYFTKLAKKTESTLDDQLVPLLKKVLQIAIVLLGGLVIMDSLEIPILPLLAGLSIGGLAFALAAQDTIKNFFGSIMIFIDKPFQIGDWITTREVDGTVEEVGFRSTRVRTFRNSVVYVPNGMLADSIVDNHGLRQFRRFKTNISIIYSTPPDRIEIFVEGLKRILHNHPKTNKEKYEIHLNEFGTSSLDILFYIFFEAPTWSDELKFRQEIILSILRLARHLNISFAFPTQTLHVENLPGQKSLSPEYTWDQDELNKKFTEFFD